MGFTSTPFNRALMFHGSGYLRYNLKVARGAGRVDDINPALPIIRNIPSFLIRNVPSFP